MNKKNGSVLNVIRIRQKNFSKSNFTENNNENETSKLLKIFIYIRIKFLLYR